MTTHPSRPTVRAAHAPTARPQRPCKPATPPSGANHRPCDAAPAEAHRRRLPPYGRALLELRLTGERPVNSVWVTAGARAWKWWRGPWGLVIPDDADPDGLDLRPLHGLEVILAFDTDMSAARLSTLAGACLAVHPACLFLFLMDDPPRTFFLKRLRLEGLP